MSTPEVTSEELLPGVDGSHPDSGSEVKGRLSFSWDQSFISTTGIHQLFDEQGLRGTVCRLLFIKSVSASS